MAIKEWPAPERPRERLLALGPAALTDAELLALLLRHGTPGRDAVGLARELLGATRGLRRLVELPLPAFTALPGLGSARYAELHAALELSRRYLREGLDRPGPIGGPEGAKDYLLAQFKPLQREVFACLFLDNQHAVIGYEELFRGTIDGASVYPREVVKRCLALNAAAVIFAHNHPSGIAEPSQADQRLTQRLKAALGTVDIRVLDHFVVGEAEALSFSERGLL